MARRHGAPFLAQPRRAVPEAMAVATESGRWYHCRMEANGMMNVRIRYLGRDGEAKAEMVRKDVSEEDYAKLESEGFWYACSELGLGDAFAERNGIASVEAELIEASDKRTLKSFRSHV